MQDLFSTGAKETRAALSELFERITYHPQRISPSELASDVVRELAHMNLLREEGAQPPKPIVHPDVATLDGVDESNDEGDWDKEE